MVAAVPRWMKITMVLVMSAFVIGGVRFYQVQEQEQEKRVQEGLYSIARLKVNQIADWRRERVSDAGVMMDSPYLAENIARWMKNPNPGATEKINIRLESMKKRYGYEDVLLADAAGRIRFSLSGAVRVDREELAGIAEAYKNRSPRLLDIHTQPDGSPPHISVIAPIFSENGNDPIGAVILINLPKKYLYPLIQSWTVPSKTAETLLVRRDGNDVLFLNPLRHQPDTAMKLRIPLSRINVPAVMAAQGRTGIVEGLDYRGVDTIAAILPVPESPWFVVAKMDKREAFSDWRFRSILILALILGLSAVTLGAFSIIWQHGEKERYRMQFLKEAALRAAEKRHAITLNSIGDAVIAADASGHVELINPAAERLTGWPNEEAKGRPIKDVFHIVDATTGAEMENPVDKVLAEGRVVDLANHASLIARDGTHRSIDDSGAPIRDEEGNMRGVVLVFRDRTEERKTRRDLATANQRLELAQTVAGMGVWDWDQKTNVSQWSQRMFDLAGLDSSRHQASLDAWLGAVHPEDRQKVVDHLNDARRNRTSTVNEYRIVRPDGELRWIFTSAKVFSEPGASTQMLGICLDVTNLKRAEETLRENETFIRTVLNNLPVGVAVHSTGPDVIFQYMNDLFPKIYRTTREALSVPNGFWDAVFEDPVFRKEIRKRTMGDYAGNDPEHLYWEDIPITRQGQATFYITAKSIRVPDRDLMIAAVWDVTEHKVAEAEKEKLQTQLTQAQKMESVGRLAGGVAHDFNNMLNIIFGHTDLALAKVDPSQPLYANLQAIRMAAERSANLTRQLLAFARKQTIAPRVIDLNDTVASILSMLQRLIGEDIHLSWRPCGGLWPVLIDPGQIDQVLANLCINARDAINTVGDIAIETENVHLDEAFYRIHTDAAPGDYVLLAVADNGSGMDQSTIDNLFEPFFTTKDLGEGTGLGLATVYGIVKQNAGFIHVDSEPARGSTFKIYLPRHRGDIRQTPQETDAADAGGGPETILLVEDEEILLDLGKMMLESLGYTVLAAGTPGRALRLAEEHAGEIDLLITDVVMPEMNGRELAQTLLIRYPGMKQLFMSGYTADVIANRGVLDEGIEFIQKPFSMNELATKIKEVLAK